MIYYIWFNIIHYILDIWSFMNFVIIIVLFKFSWKAVLWLVPPWQLAPYNSATTCSANQWTLFFFLSVMIEMFEMFLFFCYQVIKGCLIVKNKPTGEIFTGVKSVTTCPTLPYNSIIKCSYTQLFESVTRHNKLREVIS